MLKKSSCRFLLFISFLIAFQLMVMPKPLLNTAYASEVNQLKVCGDAVIEVVPDISLIHLGIQKKDKSVEVAQTKAALVLNKIIKMLKDEGVSEDDIQTSNYSVYPEYSYEKNTSKFAGYNVSYSLNVKIRDIKKSGIIMQKAVQEGSNVGSGISYEISNEKEYYQKALALAVQDAKSKATALADSLGNKNLQIISITEKQTGFTTIKRAAYSDFANNEANIMPGQVAVSACVEVTFGF